MFPNHTACGRLGGRAAALMCGLIVCGLAGCGPRGANEATQRGQVVARVNGQEITIHQVNRILQRMPGMNPQQAEEARAQVLQRLIDAELSRQQAVQEKLDRSPDVLASVESAKAEVIANAYLQRIQEGLPPPSDEQVARFLDEHPELFRNRSVFRMTEVVIAARPMWAPELTKFAASAKSMEEIRAWLQQRNTEFGTNISVRSTDQFPIEQAAAVNRAKPRDFLVYPLGQGLAVGQVESVSPAPVQDQAARPTVRMYLTQQARNEATRKEIERLRAASKIELVTAPAAPPPATSATSAEQPSAPSAAK